MSLSEAASTGDRVVTLRELRDVLASQIEVTDSGRDVAALSRQLTDVLAQIDVLAPSKAEVDVVDEIATRRHVRRSSAPPSKTRSKRSS